MLISSFIYPFILFPCIDFFHVLRFFNIIDQDYAVFEHHAHQSECANDGHEVKGAARKNGEIVLILKNPNIVIILNSSRSLSRGWSMQSGL